MFPVCGVSRYPLCPSTNEGEIEVGVPIDLPADFSEPTKERDEKAFTFFPVIGCLEK